MAETTVAQTTVIYSGERLTLSGPLEVDELRVHTRSGVLTFINRNGYPLRYAMLTILGDGELQVRDGLTVVETHRRAL